MKKKWIKCIAAFSAMVLALSLSGCGAPREMEISVMSQNVRYDNYSDGEGNDIFYRSERFAQLLDEHQPDIAGLQEYTPTWDTMMYEYLEEKGYGIVLEYRSDLSKEASPIIYKTEKYELLESCFYWLSDTPEEPSLSWDDSCERIVTECIFKDKASGIKFVCINTHFGLTATSQINAAVQIHDRIEAQYGDMPVFLTGDFNIQEYTPTYLQLTENDLIFNSSLLAEEFGETCGTFNGFEEGRADGPIDFCFVTRQVTPLYYSVLTDKPDGGFVSDHYAVFTKHKITK